MYEQEKKLFTAALFMSPRPLSLRALSRVMGVESNPVALKIAEEAAREFNQANPSLEIARVGEKYVMRVKPDLADKVSHLAVSPELGRAVLRTLALIALRQPVKQSDVVKVIGNKAYEYVKELEARGIIRAEKSGNTKILRTTRKFEEYFGKTPEELQQMAFGK